MSIYSVSELERGLRAGEIVPYFQPQVNLRTSAIYGMEVLARWHHPRGGIILPGDFIPLAEVGDLIGELTDTVVSAAAKQAAEWPECLMLAVNISPIELRDWTLPYRLQAAAERGGLPMTRLIVEVTESALIGNLELVQPLAHDLKSAGARLSLDDFGTGYSCMSHLQALPFDEIKLDASFVSCMNRDRHSRKIVEAMVGLAHSFGLSTVAEGVEEQSQADMLAALGCEFAQGYFFGRAVPAEGTADQIAALQWGAGADGKPNNTQSVFHLGTRPTEPLAQLEALYGCAPAGLCLLDRNLRWVSLNRRFADMHGRSPEAFLGRTLREVLPDLSAQIEQDLFRALWDENSQTRQLEMSSSTSSSGMLLSCQSVRDEAGDVVGICLVLTNHGEKAGT